MPAGLEGFRSSESRAHDGSIETEQRVFIPAPVVPLTEDGEERSVVGTGSRSHEWRAVSYERARATRA